MSKKICLHCRKPITTGNYCDKDCRILEKGTFDERRAAYARKKHTLEPDFNHGKFWKVLTKNK